jgi:2'-5' RNA ligase
VKRAFFALFPPAPALSELGAYLAGLRRELRTVSWIRADNLHLTLRFLGDLDDAQLARAGRAAAAAVSGRAAFELTLAGEGAFPSLQNPRVAWLGVEKGRGELVGLAAELELALIREGLGRADKPFSPHLTLGRVKGAIPPQALPALFRRLPAPACAFTAQRLDLMESRLQAGGSVYSVLQSFPLTAPGSTG